MNQARENHESINFPCENCGKWLFYENSLEDHKHQDHKKLYLTFKLCQVCKDVKEIWSPCIGDFSETNEGYLAPSPSKVEIKVTDLDTRIGGQSSFITEKRTWRSCGFQVGIYLFNKRRKVTNSINNEKRENMLHMPACALSWYHWAVANGGF